MFTVHISFNLKVSPQFCDELTENGTHLKVNWRRTRKNPRPLQEVKELFPEAPNNVQKSTVNRNPLRFEKETNKTSTSCNKENCTSHSGWCSQDISLYPSTCLPQSKQRNRDKSGRSDDGESFTDEESEKCDNQQVQDWKNENPDEDMGSSELNASCLVRQFDNAGWSDCQADANECGEVMQLNERGCRECPSLSEEQKCRSMPSQTVVGDHTVPSASQEQNELRGNTSDFDMRLRLSDATHFTETQNPSQDRELQTDEMSAQCRPHSQATQNEDVELRLGTCRRTSPYDYMYMYHRSETNENSVLAEQLAKAAFNDTTETQTDCDPDNLPSRHMSCATCSMENLSEMIKDMSVGDSGLANPKQLRTCACVQSALADHSDSSKMDRLDPIQVPQEMFGNPTSSCNVLPSQFEVATFKPPVASTPFRDQCSPSKLLSSLQKDKALAMLYVYKSPDTVVSGLTIRTVTPADQEMSVLASETPEHLWCSPNLHRTTKQELKPDKHSFKVSESMFKSINNSVLNSDLALSENIKSSFSRQMCDDMDDIDMITFNNFDDSDTRHTQSICAMETSTCNVDKHDDDGCSLIPPTQDSTYGSDREWSILVKQTPDDLWCSPIVKVVDDSFSSQ